MTITLYQATPSANTDRVRIVLHEKSLDYTAVTLSLEKKEQKDPAFLKLNPYGKVPVLVDDGTVLFESCIINEYLDERYPHPKLMPSDPHLRARVRMITDYALNHIHEPYWTLRGEMIKPEPPRDSKSVRSHQETLISLRITWRGRSRGRIGSSVPSVSLISTCGRGFRKWQHSVPYRLKRSLGFTDGFRE